MKELLERKKHTERGGRKETERQRMRRTEIFQKTSEESENSETLNIIKYYMRTEN